MPATRPSAAVMLAAFGILGAAAGLFVRSRSESEIRVEVRGPSPDQYVRTVYKAEQRDHRDETVLDSEIGALREEVRQADSRLGKAYRDIAEMEKDIVSLSRAKNEMESELAWLRYDAALKPVPSVPVAAEPKIDGFILEWSRNLNLVQISVGQREQVQVGYRFTVYRGSTYVSKIVVERVDEDGSVCRELSEFRKEVIQKGDSVSTRVFD